MADSNTQKVEAKFTEAFDVIMEIIEPDLCSYNIQNIEEKYAHETEKEKEQRKERYKIAYAQCEEILDSALSKWTFEYKKFSKWLQKQFETTSKEKDEEALSDLENLFT